jgi:hypothetical protein
VECIFVRRIWLGFSHPGVLRVGGYTMIRASKKKQNNLRKHVKREPESTTGKVSHEERVLTISTQV